jgi:putative PIN family toxin of toxin-antitoxin system
VRAVLDLNVIVSAVLSRGGTSAKLLRSWLDGDYELVVSPSLLAELERVLSYPKITRRVTPDEAQELLNLLRQQADLSEDPTRAPTIASPDPTTTTSRASHLGGARTGRRTLGSPTR